MFKRLFILVLISVLLPLSTQASIGTNTFRSCTEKALLKIQVLVAILRDELPEVQKDFFCNNRGFNVNEGWRIDQKIMDWYHLEGGDEFNEYIRADMAVRDLRDYGIAMYCWKGDAETERFSLQSGWDIVSRMKDVAVFNTNRIGTRRAVAVYSLEGPVSSPAL